MQNKIITAGVPVSSRDHQSPGDARLVYIYIYKDKYWVNIGIHRWLVTYHSNFHSFALHHLFYALFQSTGVLIDCNLPRDRCHKGFVLLHLCSGLMYLIVGRHGFCASITTSSDDRTSSNTGDDGSMQLKRVANCDSLYHIIIMSSGGRGRSDVSWSESVDRFLLMSHGAQISAAWKWSK